MLRQGDRDESLGSILRKAGFSGHPGNIVGKVLGICYEDDGVYDLCTSVAAVFARFDDNDECLEVTFILAVPQCQIKLRPGSGGVQLWTVEVNQRTAALLSLRPKI